MIGGPIFRTTDCAARFSEGVITLLIPQKRRNGLQAHMPCQLFDIDPR